MRRNDRRNLLLLAIFAPVFLVAFSLHVKQAFETGLAQPAFFVSNPAPDAYPVVRGFRLEHSGGGEAIEIGDRLIRIGDVDLRGVGNIAVDALAIEAAGERGWVPFVLERGGHPLAAREELARNPFPWARIPALLGVFVVCVGVLLRGPRTAQPRLFFVTFMTFAIQQTAFHGGSYYQTVASKLLFYTLGVVAPALMLRWCVGFPDEAPRPGRLARALPWLFAPAFAFLRADYFRGGPLPPGVAPIAVQLLDGLLLVVILGVLTRNYLRADPVGRRRVKWLLYGTYVGFVPWIAVHLLPMSPGLYSRAINLSAIATVAMPLGILIAIVRQHLFDIDRLISVTASYSILGIALVGLASLAVPGVARAASETLGVDPVFGERVLTFALAAAAFPLGQRLWPVVDRRLFPAHHSLETAMPLLLLAIAGCRSAGELATRVGEDLARLLEPESCLIYARTDTAFVPVFVRGPHAATELALRSPFVKALEECQEVLVCAPAAGLRRYPRESGPLRVLLHDLGVEAAAPVRVGDRLTAVITLGPKRSGDVYTAGEVAWLGAVAERMGAELYRFDATELIRRSRELQAAYRAYVPGSVAEQIESGGALEEGVCDIAVLFVDLRGYTSFSERRDAREVFSTVNRYTETVSRIVRAYGGTVVEFNGDGMMAVFGAPRALAAKERASVEAGEAILHEVPSLSTADGSPLAVGVGIATGPAFVGSIQAVDRRIWSALGNTTNFAARLQQLSRTLGAGIVIDDATFRSAGAQSARYRRYPATRIRGLTEPRDVYAIPI